MAIAQAANMPNENEAIEGIKETNPLFASGKTENTEGFAVSGLEMKQNIIHLAWNRDELEALKNIMYDYTNNVLNMNL